MSERLYLNDAYLFEVSTNIVDIKKDDNGIYCLLDQTIFYPKGGGQPSDRGKIKGDGFEYVVSNVLLLDGENRHYIEQEAIDHTRICAAAVCILDAERRLLNGRYHTAGHLIGNVVADMYPALVPLKCHAFPGEAYIEFQGDVVIDVVLISDSLQRDITQNLAIEVFEIDRDSFEIRYYKLPYEIPGNKDFRVMQIGDYPPVPCGGTHLSSTKEVGNINLNKVKQKGGKTKISFSVS